MHAYHRPRRRFVKQFDGLWEEVVGRHLKITELTFTLRCEITVISDDLWKLGYIFNLNTFFVIFLGKLHANPANFSAISSAITHR